MNLLHYKPVDRLPAVQFGYWPELLEEWAAQGKIPAELAHDNHDGSDKDHELDKIIGWDFNYSHVIGSNDHLDPVFEEKVTEEFGVRAELITEIGPVIGAHSGPGTLAIFFLGVNK